MADFFRKYLLHNLGLKLVSLALATCLWLAIVRDPLAEVAVDVPIELQNIPANLEVSSEHIPQAQIRVRGPERLIGRLQATDIHAAISLNQVTTGEHTFDLTANRVHEPQGLEVVQIIPTQLHLAFDTRVTRSIDVRPRIIGTFASGYSIARVEVVPPNVSITGPRQRVEALETAMTDPIDASGNIDRASFTVHAYVSDPLIQLVDPATVRVTVIMQKGAITQSPGSSPSPTPNAQ